MGHMLKLSANLGFLWHDLPLPEAIRAAAAAGFDAVECHWPYDVDPVAVKAAMDDTGLPMLSLNTERGGGFGLSAVEGQEDAARAAIDQAIQYGAAIGAQNIHIMAGFASGKAAHQRFVASLRYALARGAGHGIAVLIEPINHRDAPGYFLQTADQAAAIIAEIGDPKLRLMFDCYHLQIMQGDLGSLMKRMHPIIGHIQIAAVPDRSEPDHGEVDYREIFVQIEEMGYSGHVGAEYRPRGDTEAGLGWFGLR